MMDSLQFEQTPQQAVVHDGPKQERSLLTRQQLIDAARTIFARDGFDKASLQDISALAGKTRGAFYTHFEDKEDVFFAIFEQDIAGDQEKFRKRLKRASNKEKRVMALASHIVDLVQDKERMLLTLEFKMYVLRHPHKQQRLADLHTAICIQGCGVDMELLLPELYPEAGSRKTRQHVAQFGAIIDGLALNRLFDPQGMDSATLLKLAVAGVRAVL
jgi:AcrR family transcriptional regulator